MNPMKRVGVLALLLAGVLVCASAPATAKPKDGDGTSTGTVIELTNKVGDERAARGEALLMDVTYLGQTSFAYGYYVEKYYSGTLSVACSRLTPGAEYWTPAGSFVADARGQGAVTAPVQFSVTWCVPSYDDPYYWEDPYVVSSYVVSVYRLNTDGTETHGHRIKRTVNNSGGGCRGQG